MRAHSFQAPTLIGCSIVKERVLRHPNYGAVKSLPSAGRCVAAAPEAEKRDYEAVFLVCQAKVGNFLKIYLKLSKPPADAALLHNLAKSQKL